MSTKVFCDCCSAEITPPRGDLMLNFKHPKTARIFRIGIYADPADALDLCDRCKRTIAQEGKLGIEL